MLPYFEKTNLISNEDVKFLENLCKSSEANFVAYDTVSGKRDGNLCWDMDLAYFKRFNYKCYTMFVHQEPNAKVVEHKDNTKWKRNTVLIVPLFWHEDYAPCYFTDGTKVTHESPILFNTQIPHYINNNELPFGQI